MPTARILFYAINGTGLGHLSRLLAIARQARELLACQGVESDFHFLTTSEAAETAWDFPVYKLPSKTVAVGPAVTARQHASRCKLMISNIVAGIRPDLLVMDTQPQGAYQEFVFLRDYAKVALFIDRRKDRELAAGKVHQSHLALYDRILVPDEAANAGFYPIPRELEARRRFIGPVSGMRPNACLSIDAVRRVFGALEGQRLIYISAGGGGDREAEHHLNQLLDVVAADPAHLCVIGYGPLFRGQRRYTRNTIALAETEAWRYFRGWDAAFSAGGYNSYQELLAAGVPTCFFAQQKGMDRQEERLAEGAAKGWHLVLPGFDRHHIQHALQHLLDGEQSQVIRDQLAQRTLAQGALRGAVELLELQAFASPNSLDTAALYPAALTLSDWQTHLDRPALADPLDFAKVWQWRLWLVKTCGDRIRRLDEADQARFVWQSRRADGDDRRDDEMHWAAWITALCDTLAFEPGLMRKLLARLFKACPPERPFHLVRGLFDQLEYHFDQTTLQTVLRALLFFENPRTCLAAFNQLLAAADQEPPLPWDLHQPASWPIQL